MKRQAALREYFTLSAPLRAQIRRTAAAFAILIAVGFLSGLFYPDLLKPMLTGFTDAAAQAGLYEVKGGTLMVTILSNNLLAALEPIAVGLIPFLHLPAFSVGLNAMLTGGLAAFYQTSGLGLPAFLAGTLPHGITELAALSVACGAGLHVCATVTGRILGRDTAFTTVQALTEALRAYAVWVLPLLTLSSALEAFVTPLIFSRFL